MAMVEMLSAMCPISVAMDFKNLRRAGVLKKSCFTVIIVPGGAPVSDTFFSFPPSRYTSVAVSDVFSLVVNVNRETDAMLGSASPLKPSVCMENKSESLEILLVAYRSMASMASSRFIPMPLSDIRISDRPPFSISINIRVLFASRAFSRSSFTTEAGRSTTSPAAILLERTSGSILIIDIKAKKNSGWMNHKAGDVFRNRFLL